MSGDPKAGLLFLLIMSYKIIGISSDGNKVAKDFENGEDAVNYGQTLLTWGCYLNGELLCGDDDFVMDMIG